MKKYKSLEPSKHNLSPPLRDQIRKDKGVREALTTVGQFARSVSEKARYKPTIVLLNRLSLLYYELTQRNKDASPAIVFSFCYNRVVTGSYLGDQCQPDYSAFAGTYEDLLAAISGVAPNKPWSVLVGVGEHKKGGERTMAQLKSYLRSLRQYRVDIPTVHGFQVSGLQVELASLNGCGMWKSPILSTGWLRSWLALVASLYHSTDNRDAKLNYSASQTQFHRWDVHYGPEPFATVPFHVGDAPGRVTFAAFELGPASWTESKLSHVFFNGLAEGFFKVSWQDKAARWTESQLLTHLHAEEWLPGLVRHKYAHRDDDKLAITRLGEFEDEEDEKKQGPVERVREVIHLGSIGEPLSEARTLRHVLCAIYDFLETSDNMREKDVIHRDLSWHNCLIFPRHTVRGEKREGSRPCIRRILAKAGVDLPANIADIGVRAQRHVDDEDEYEPCGLITDLDHSALITGLEALSKAGRRDRTGTPMFIATALSDPGSIAHMKSHGLAALAGALRLVETTESGKRALEAAFPGTHSDGQFMAMFDRVAAAEANNKPSFVFGKKKAEAPPATLPDPATIMHEPRHDAESLFWVTLWAFARARPRGSSTSEGKASDFNAFCRDMLSHKIGEEASRKRYLNPDNLDSTILHPDFRELMVLFHAMASYLSVPWHLYANDPYIKAHSEHVHTAFRRLILASLLSDAPELDIELDTEQPRFTNAFEDVVRVSSVPSTDRAATGNMESISQVLADPQRASQSQSALAAPSMQAPASSVDPQPSARDLRAQNRASHREVAPAGSSGSRSSKKRSRGVDNRKQAPSKKARPEQSWSDSEAEDDLEIKAPSEADDATLVDEQHQASTNSPKEVLPDDGEIAKQPVSTEQKYSAVDHASTTTALRQSANALRLKFWKDKSLWFGSGA
ncbi:hypothetical protein EXIGLDRAFT_844208 [Exidia glandulosa HHB12029]|uniref:Fungal-type protein kinase domain-containing protein n=1 Tax=Exidia glandulosa HHB12029 TaxID=1314781 RepID=A0A165ZEB9_EXIGL|nr:hypothetical protein EXIGLDRAFT_844208 [Exidia glandulosa HHB12029]